MRLGEARLLRAKKSNRLDEVEAYLREGKRTIEEIMAHFNVKYNTANNFLRYIEYECEPIPESERKEGQLGRLGKRYWLDPE